MQYIFNHKGAAFPYQISWLVLFSIQWEENDVVITLFSIPIPNPNPTPNVVCL